MSNPEGFTRELEKACAERCADYGDPPCWRMPELCDPCEHVTPCAECVADVAAEQVAELVEGLRGLDDALQTKDSGKYLDLKQIVAVGHARALLAKYDKGE